MNELNFPYHLTGLRNMETDHFNEIFKLTKIYKQKILNKTPFEKILEDKSVINLFFEDSTRTRTSFELAEKKLGMNVVNFSASGSSISKGESFLDTLKNIESMKFDYIVIRHQDSGTPAICIKHTSSKVINAGDGINEQDPLPLRPVRVGNISHSRVALSNIFALKKFKANVSVCGPLSFIPACIEGLGVNVYLNIDDAIKNNDALNILRVQTERDAATLLPSLNEYSRHYGINSERLKNNPGIKIMHPGPMNINVEIDHKVSASENSLIFEQVTNGLAVKCAVFELMNKI